MQVHSQIVQGVVSPPFIDDISFEVKPRVIEDNRVCLLQSKAMFVEQIPGSSEIGRVLKICRVESNLIIKEAFRLQLPQLVLPFPLQIDVFPGFLITGRQQKRWVRGERQIA